MHISVHWIVTRVILSFGCLMLIVTYYSRKKSSRNTPPEKQGGISSIGWLQHEFEFPLTVFSESGAEIQSLLRVWNVLCNEDSSLSCQSILAICRQHDNTWRIIPWLVSGLITMVIVGPLSVEVSPSKMAYINGWNKWRMIHHQVMEQLCCVGDDRGKGGGVFLVEPRVFFGHREKGFLGEWYSMGNDWWVSKLGFSKIICFLSSLNLYMYTNTSCS